MHKAARMAIPRLIACDVDGTLLPTGQRQLAPSTITLIQRLLDKGIVFVPASGRQYPSLKRVFAPFSASLPLIAENGTIALAEGTCIFRATMERSLGDEIVYAARARETCEVMVSGAEVSYLQPKTTSFLELLRDAIKYRIVVVDDVTTIDEPYSKIAIYHPDAYREAPYWRERFGSRCAVTVSGDTWVDLMPKGISKASGLRAICELYNIAPHDCMAIGDADNDVELFNYAGDSYAMQTASARAKEHANHIVASADDVFAAILAEMHEHGETPL